MSMRKAEMIKAISLPLWKQDFVRKNRKLYADNQQFIDKWLAKWNVLGTNEDGEIISRSVERSTNGRLD